MVGMARWAPGRNSHYSSILQAGSRGNRHHGVRARGF